MEKIRVAFPSEGQGGIDGQRSGHFGHCDVFTLVDLEGGEVKEVTTVNNKEHVQGGCMVPVNLLASHNVNAIVVGGIGMRPLMGFNQAGITVYHEAQTREIKPVLDAFIAGKIPVIQEDQVCGGGGH
ncbi:MAG: dinitrogenase iron-molybdenum cofactor biosynthesis protein [Deltaproteobacteria bacterium]|nr:MAG: dinitrogenase iron-molybdenum cofactor biosynthesis protein [Deltaproteobacteria bacterium]